MKRGGGGDGDGGMSENEAEAACKYAVYHTISYIAKETNEEVNRRQLSCRNKLFL